MKDRIACKALSKPYLSVYFSLLAGLWLIGCSAERKGPLSKAYHNTTARYNAFFLGNERLKELEAGVAAKAIPDYNRLLPVFPVIDSTIAAGFRKELDEIIKKASFPVQKHPTSDWIDNSYLLIGKARFYGLEYDDAIKTFKYVNSTSQSEETRHEALLWLMRSFVTVQDLESAKAVSDIMKKQFLNKENATMLFLTRAQYHILRQENELATENLNLAIPLIEKKDEEARIRFILAQVYQETNQDQLAYKQFNYIIRKNPPYELGFQSKLHLGQVTALTSAADKEKIDKYFRKLQKDAKNQEYLDKIFYEMARFELKQGKPDPALKYLAQSVRASKNNPGQKGYSYLLAGQIYYDKLQKYRLAQAYYDSAVQVLPPTAAEFRAAAERRDILNEFALNYTVVEREDSLQALASLSPADLAKKIEAIMVQAEEQKVIEAKRLAEAASRNGNQTPNNSLSNSPFGNLPGQGDRTNNPATAATTNALWYFDNPATVGSAKAEFARRWGNRRLQDNWRTANQAATDPQQDLTANNTRTPLGEAQDPAAQQDAVRQDLMVNIPLTPEKRAASNKQIEEGLFNLANIYRDRLKEPARAIETYEKLLTRFPKSEHVAEASYALYLLHKEAKDAKQNTYANLVKQQFPNSRYAKLIDQPDYMMKVSAGNAKVRQLYDAAYALYDDGKYAQANTALSNIRRNYADSDLDDKIAFLQVLIIAKTQQPAAFKSALQQFVKNYPSSTLSEKAQQYLQSFTLYESGKLSEAEFNKTHPVQKKPAPATTEKREEPVTAGNAVAANAAIRLPTRKPEPKSTPAETAKNQTAPKQTTASEKPVTEKTNSSQITADSAATQIASTAPAGPASVNSAPAVPAPVEAKYAVNAQAPHLVIIAYPKDHAAFTGMPEKVQLYNSKYNAADNLLIELSALNVTQNLILIRNFSNGAKAKDYAIKQKSPQSPLSKIRGIKFDTFVISSDNLPVLLQDGKLEEYLTFYKNNY